MTVLYKYSYEGTLARYKCVGHPASKNEEGEPYEDAKEGCGFEFDGVPGPSQGYQDIGGERHDIPTACPQCGMIYVQWMNYDEMYKEWSNVVDSVDEN